MARQAAAGQQWAQAGRLPVPTSTLALLPLTAVFLVTVLRSFRGSNLGQQVIWEPGKGRRVGAGETDSGSHETHGLDSHLY